MTPLVAVAQEVRSIVTSEHPKHGDWIAYNPKSDTPYGHAYIKEYPGVEGSGTFDRGVLVACAAHPVWCWSSSPHQSDVEAALGIQKFTVAWLGEDALPKYDIRYPEGWGQWVEF